MMRWLAVVAFLPVAAVAEPVTIRSGEHETFTRLVVAIGEGTSWAVEPSDIGYTLELSGRLDGFDTAGVFDRIPRDRIATLLQLSQNTLSLEVECACYADAFLWQPGQLVIDIVDGTDPDPPEVTSGGAFVEPDSDQGIGAELPNLLEIAEATSPVFGPLTSLARAVETVPENPDLQETEAALIEGLARAASQGFLDAALTQPRGPEKPAQEDPPNEPVEVLEVVDVPTPMSVPQPGIGISTAMDRDLAIIRDVLNANADQQCLPADFFAIHDWGDDRPFHEQAASLAEALAGEFGEEPLAAQDDLARLYLHFGFGAEARAVLSADMAQSQERQVMAELAGLIDEYDGNYRLIETQAGCDTPAALWAFYAAPSILEEDTRNHVLQEFFALPQPLRGQIAPRLSRSFIEVADPDAAAKLLRASENHDAEATHEVQSARALIAEEIGDRDQAISVLAQEADDNARTTPESLIRLIELGIENGVAPQEKDLILVAAMRQEHRGTPLADQLAVVEAAGRARLGDYQAVLDILSGRDDLDALTTIDSAFSHMTKHASSADFLGFSYDALPLGLTSQTENEMARRLIDLGFSERAQEILAGPALREAAAERRYLRAEAANAVGNHVAAIDALLGLTDSRARDLRAEAYVGLGNHREAIASLDPADDTSADPALQFRAGAWERLTVDDDEVLSSFAQTRLAPAATQTIETLADRRAILAQSQESRRAVEGLLQRFDIETEQE